MLEQRAESSFNFSECHHKIVNRKKWCILRCPFSFKNEFIAVWLKCISILPQHMIVADVMPKHKTKKKIPRKNKKKSEMVKCQLGNNTSNPDDNRQHFIFFEQTECTPHTHQFTIQCWKTKHAVFYKILRFSLIFYWEPNRHGIPTSNHTIQNNNLQIDTREQISLSSQKMMFLLFNLPKIPKTKFNWLSSFSLLLLFIERYIDRVLGAVSR